ncbi:hypothetical protein LY76DRAFT_44086 [Colletotrichum caudatum]|nr:hypothetical protein LY76DRAFT_44086 [Colletotrichum caudatum]
MWLVIFLQVSNYSLELAQGWAPRGWPSADKEASHCFPGCWHRCVPISISPAARSVCLASPTSCLDVLLLPGVYSVRVGKSWAARSVPFPREVMPARSNVVSRTTA